MVTQAAAAETIQVSLWNFTNVQYVMTVNQSQHMTEAMVNTIEGVGVLEVRRKILEGDAYACVRFQPAGSTEWQGKCHQLSGNSSGRLDYGPYALGIASSELLEEAPAPTDPGGVVALTSDRVSCPMGESEYCWTFEEMSVPIVQCWLDPSTGLGIYYCVPEMVSVEVTECKCMPDTSSDTPDDTCEPADVITDWVSL